MTSLISKYTISITLTFDLLFRAFPYLDMWGSFSALIDTLFLGQTEKSTFVVWSEFWPSALLFENELFRDYFCIHFCDIFISIYKIFRILVFSRLSTIRNLGHESFHTISFSFLNVFKLFLEFFQLQVDWNVRHHQPLPDLLESILTIQKNAHLTYHYRKDPF